MGLDMSIKARKTITKRTITDKELKEAKDGFLPSFYGKLDFEQIPEDLQEFREFTDSNLVNVKIDYPIAYFRKFNALHNYFVENCDHPDGQDNCVDMLITPEIIDDLILRLTKIILADGKQKVAEQELPTADGFFWGDTSYDEYYLKDCKKALELMLKMKALAEESEEEEQYEFYYIAWY